MSRSKQTVLYLAGEANLDPDEALLRLWFGGIEYIKTVGSKVRSDDLDTARETLGLLPLSEIASPLAWRSHLGLNSEEFSDLELSLGLEYTNSGRLRGKSIRRLESIAKTSREMRPPQIRQVDPRRQSKGAISPKVRKSPPLQWPTIGKERPVRYLVKEEVEKIYDLLVDHFAHEDDPMEPPGIRDENLLASALSRPETSLGEKKKYPTVEMAGAALLHSLIHNHPFYNGNKRTALVAMMAFLDTNGYLVTFGQDEAFRFIISVAEHSLVNQDEDQLADRETVEIARWIVRNTRQIELSDRPVAFRRLRKLLSRFNCQFEISNAGQMVISREVQAKRFLRRPVSEGLISQVSYGGEGREIGKGVMARIRRDLKLDEQNGIDSAIFYDNAPAIADAFIEEFRTTLRRLARR